MYVCAYVLYILFSLNRFANFSFSFFLFFSQLYELNDDAGRKAFLDELFDFMQKRGKSLNFVVFIREAKHCRRLRKLL